MEIYYKDVKINYIVQFKGVLNIVYLHGWGGNVNSMLFLADCINANNILIDFPPFGKSEEPKTAFTLEDYTNIVIKVLNKENIKRCIIISHSFGSRVAIKVASKYNIVDGLIITGGAGLRPRNKIKKTFRHIKYKIIKVFNKKCILGSKDYVKLSKTMKKTFSNIVNNYQEEEAKNVLCKTLLIYGNKDKETPVYMGKKYNKLITNSKLKIYKNCGHFAYIENKEQFLLDSLIFIKEQI